MVARAIGLLGLLAGCDTFLSIPAVQAYTDAALDAPDAPSIDASIDLQAGLVARYSFDTLPDTGACLVDDSGHGHDGTCTGSPALVSGKFGEAWSLALSPIDVEIADAPDLDGSTGLTVATWLQISSDPPDFECAANRPIAASDGNYWQICVQPGHVYVGIGNFDVSTPSGLPVNEWHHVALTWDGTFGSVWVDGLLQSSSRTTVTMPDQAIAIGVDHDFNNPISAPYPGLIDELRIYNRALDTAELAQLAQ
jgi:hypothetical protein